ncbi:metallophosphoesterase [Arhodomonas aquaeolei]|uniref:metallophosphoesterase family protein n=1 Tax=Arhodomonas aquaeolei TaxID=2369 RepID=UPI00216A6D5C|nr:metallophosphoesterase [Arhodomonas aquaeolei]MCS4503114.1 metallophosphoesterase [Arhodomonas aquaeolei]
MESTNSDGARGLAFAHLSDPHLTSLRALRRRELIGKRLLGYLSWRRGRRHAHCDGILAALQRALASHPGEEIAVTGDLTHLGTPDEYREARDWLAALGPGPQVTVVPGNHDLYVPVRWEDTLAEWAAHMCGDGDERPRFPFERRRGPVSFIGVNTAYPSAPLLATGRIDGDQLDGIGRALARAGEAGRFRVVLMHHPPQPDAVSRRKSLLAAERFRALVRRHGAELVLHGHAHRRLRGEIDGPVGPVPVLGAPSASQRTHDPARNAAYHRCVVTPSPAGWRLAVTVHAYDTETGDFAPRADAGHTLEIPRQSA